ncbi:MAG: NHL repeat-containing protein [Candidatus Acidiferrales bacterium]
MKNLGARVCFGVGILLACSLSSCGGGSGGNFSSGGGGGQGSTPPGIYTVAGTGVSGYTGDGGPAQSAELNSPYGVSIDALGNIYIADTGNRVIRKVDSSGKITTIAGNGNQGYNGDGMPAVSAALYAPYRVVADRAGNVYIADYYNNRIRKVDTSGTITTVAGTGTQGYNGDGIPASTAQLNFPSAVAVDASGNIYIADTWNNLIRKIDTSGMISTIAGTGFPGVLGDGGPATSAQVYQPIGLAVDSLGNVYIADFGNSKIRKVDTSGTINTIAGTGSIGNSGDGGPATAAFLNQPTGVAVDRAGNVYIADNQNSRVRKVDTSGTITTIVSTSTSGISALFFPEDVAVDAAGHVYIADNNNMRILELR